MVDAAGSDGSTARYQAALTRLAKWRTWLAGWQLGTRPASDGPSRAVRDAAEDTGLSMWMPAAAETIRREGFPP